MKLSVILFGLLAAVATVAVIEGDYLFKLVMVFILGFYLGVMIHYWVDDYLDWFHSKWTRR